MSLIYTGIGSRETPDDILEAMIYIGERLAEKWILRSGGANGADTAFWKGAASQFGKREIFVPWAGFNGCPTIGDHTGFIVPEWTDKIMDIAARFHPAWHRCSPAARKLHARNVCQILGRDLNTPTDMVICWTPGGRSGGGTGQAIRIAKHYGVPVFDLALQENEQKLVDFMNQKEGA